VYDSYPQVTGFLMQYMQLELEWNFTTVLYAILSA